MLHIKIIAPNRILFDIIEQILFLLMYQTALQEIIVIAAKQCQLCSVFIDFNQFMRYIYSINIDTMKGIPCLESRKLSLK